MRAWYTYTLVLSGVVVPLADLQPTVDVDELALRQAQTAG